MSDPSQHSFKAEIKQLLQILIHSLYQDREIFLRELISNGSDAMTRLQFEMLTNDKVFDADAELAIHIEIVDEEDDKRLIIKDSGIGMTATELTQNLGTIAQSGAREFISKLEEGQSSPADIIGQFGVGFYSIFMVADEVKVVSRSYKPRAKAAQWISDGGENFTVEAAEKETRGTEIHIKLKSDTEEFLKPFGLREIIRKHSNYVSYPIYVDGEQANQVESIWRKKSADVSEEEHNQFYQQMTMDFEPPLSTIHFASDMPVNLRSLLFVPAKREKTMFSLRKEPGVKLYSNNVLIQEYCTDLLPTWLNFVDGVVDSEDLPLNVSRETVQNNRLMRALAKVVTKRAIRTITTMADKESEKFATFWDQYSGVIKEGMAIDPTNKDDILPLLHFVSSKSDGKLISLKTYTERMPEDQENIYYVVGNALASVANSPHLDPLKAKDWEVLYFVEPIDAFLVTSWTEFAEIPLKNVDDADVALPDDADEEEDADALSEEAANLVIGRTTAALGDRVTEVRVSKVLKSSPIRLVAPEDSGGSSQDRIQRMVNQNYEVPQRIVEINKSHPIIANLASRLESDDSSEIIDLTIEQLYESALLQEGLHPNPSAMLPRIQKLLELASK